MNCNSDTFSYCGLFTGTNLELTFISIPANCLCAAKGNLLIPETFQSSNLRQHEQCRIWSPLGQILRCCAEPCPGPGLWLTVSILWRATSAAATWRQQSGPHCCNCLGYVSSLNQTIFFFQSRFVYWLYSIPSTHSVRIVWIFLILKIVLNVLRILNPSNI